MAQNATTIQIPRETRDRLAQLAAEHGVTLGQYVSHLAELQRTKAEQDAQLAADRETVRQVIGLDISDEEFEGAPDILGNIYATAAAKVRAQGTTP